MTLRQLAVASARFNFRAHLGVVLGAALAAAVLIGALAVGDSVAVSLRERALAGVGANPYALSSGDRYFSDTLKSGLANASAGLATADLLVMPATVARGDGTRLANNARLFGVTPRYPAEFARDLSAAPLAVADDDVWVNRALAQQLNLSVGDPLVLRLAKPSALSRDAILTARNEATLAWRVTVRGVLAAAAGGDLAPQGAAGPAVFADRTRLARLTGLEGRANLLLATPGGTGTTTTATTTPTTAETLAGLQQALRRGWSLADAELALRVTNGRAELSTRRIFLEPAVVAAALTNAPATEQPVPLLTYLVNSLRHGDALTPYSMVTAAGAPYTPADLRDDEIVVNDWLAKDLGLKPGDTVDLAYYRADAGTQLREITRPFRVRSVVPLVGLHGDRTLMPDFPGLSKAESTHDWDAGFELIHTIRDSDEAYWKQYRGTPKAFITLAAGQALWSNRFGNLTAIRWQATSDAAASTLAGQVTERLQRNLDPTQVGLRFEPVRERVLAAAASGTGKDFGGLFLSLSFFLMVSALLLTAMLFRFGLEQRATELGTLLAVGWPAARVRRLFAGEGLVLATIGAVLGAVLGVGYGVGMIGALNTLWSAAVGGTELHFAVTPPTLVGGILGSIAIAAGTLWWTLRGAVRRPARELLNEGWSNAPTATAGRRNWTPWLVAVLAFAAGGMAAASLKGSAAQQQEAFFFAGMLVLVAALLGVRGSLRRPPTAGRAPARTLAELAGRAPARQPSRSLATVTLLAVATFLIVAIAAYRLDATRDASVRAAGTGGFGLWAESTLPVLQDLNTRKGQEFYGLNPKELTNVSFVALRVQVGEEASCLNLGRAQRPRLLGVRPGDLAERHAFTFTAAAPGSELAEAWKLLSSAGRGGDPAEIPVVGDAQSIQWALGRSLGDTLDYVDERGEPFRVRLVGAVANSILQGSLLMDEAALLQRFPSASGYRAFLIDVSTPAAAERTAELSRVAGTLSRALSDVGFEVTTTTARLEKFNAVQNTYLSTFQVLGGLGLLLGSVGLGVVVLRNVFERRGELGVMAAVGLSKQALTGMVLREHGRLLVLGLGIGAGAAAVAVLPAAWNPSGGFPWVTVGVTLGGVLLNGWIWTRLAARRALAGNLLEALRGE